ncbi:MAG: oligosaccharide flippase family protein [Candidatus Caldarchaeum sp.]
MFFVKRTIWSDAALYAVGIAVGRLVGFVMIPVYTRVLTPADYGIVEALARFADVLALLAGAGISAAVIKFYVGARDEIEARSVIYTAYVGIALVSTVVFSFAVPFLPMVYHSLNLSPSAYIPGYLMTGSALIDVVSLVPLACFRAQRRVATYVVYNLSRLVLALYLNILLVVWMGLGVWGVAFSGALTSVVSAFALIMLVVRDTVRIFSTRVFIDMLRYSLPLVPANLAMFILHNSDRFFLARYSPMAEVGIYSLSYRFGAVLSTLVVQPFVLMWSTEQFRLVKVQNAEEKMAWIGKVFWDVLMTSWLVLSVGSYLALRIMTPREYWAAARFVPFVLMAYAFFGINHVFQSVLYIRSSTARIAQANIVSALLCLVFNQMFIPSQGGMGAAIATLLAFGTAVAITLYHSQREMHVHYSWMQMLISLLVVMVAYLLFIKLYPLSLPLSLVGAGAVSFLLGYRAYLYLSKMPFITGSLSVIGGDTDNV